jgi:glycosyltransferase involved in cell wall biosynthesis
MMQPWLSVIMPIYNGEAYLASALDSVLLQNVRDIELIAVDGQSTDATASILKSYQDRLPIKVLQQDRKSNWVIKTNYALSFATGQYACFLHHDDLWLKDRLKIMKQLTQQSPEAVLLLHPSNYLDKEGNRVGLWSCPLPAFPQIIKPSFMMEKLLVQNFISILGPSFKREVALQVGGLDEDLWYTADWDFWLKIAACGYTVYYPKPLSAFRIHPSSQTIVGSSHAKSFREQLESVAKKHFTRWEAHEHVKQRVRRVADFSIEVNIALAGTVHGQKMNLIRLLISFVSLGSSGWYRYIRDSRIWERVSARFRAHLSPFKK